MSDLKIPKHLGIIPDGNRRWAKQRLIKPWEGHKKGLGKFREILDWCQELGIKMVTLYTFSMENFSRSKEEVDFLMEIIRRELEKMAKDEKVHKERVRIKVIGRTELLPKKLQQAIKRAEDATAHYNNYQLNLAIAYSGRGEIVDATKKIAQKIKEGKIDISEIDENTISQNIYSPMPDVDLVIRTAENRLSGFLPWQSNYAELIFLPKFFPDLTKEDFFKAIEEYSYRERRFGG